MELEFLQTLQGLHHPVLDRVLVIITTLGNAGWFFIALGLILLAFKKTRRTGFHVLLALVFSLIFCNLILNGLVARDRPSWLVPDVELLIANPKDFSFP
ncbi:MAG: phosphatase PAP2 family protein, partial [Lachnospiraceae bacterium]|nr:phosphatase PAP2 family protein [Lachnospiraceae bacterium]